MDGISAPEAFGIRLDDAELDDLAGRLRRTRFVEPTPAEKWHAGTNPAYLRELVSYWADGFNWREQEKALNVWPQFRVRIDGLWVHFVHIRAPRVEGRPEPLPLLLAHGWPSLFTEYLPLAGLLKDQFDLVIPSLPGFGYSDAPVEPVTRPLIAELWTRLMSEALGYSQYGLVGGDIGGDVAHWMAVLHPERVVGLHTIHPKVSTDGGPLSEIEQAYLRQRIEVPVGVTLSAEDAWIIKGSSVIYPRELADRSYTDIRLWHEPGKGGHFFALEEPDLLAADLHTFFGAC